MDGLIFLYLISFPFGQIIKPLPDILIGIICIYAIIRGYKFRTGNFLVVCIFSLLFSLTFFKVPQIFTGILYLIRLAGYIIFSQITYKQFAGEKKKIKLIFNSLIMVGMFIAIFGWIQYFIFPDLRVLKVLGWDDHYFRLVSTFFDPAFTGILLTLTEILLIVKTAGEKTKLNYLLNIFLIATVLFTYSRASFISLFFAMIFLLWNLRQRFILIFLVLFVVSIPFLPKVSGEGTNLARTYSVGQKFINYNESISLIRISPIFGVGFNNLCIAKEKFFGNNNTLSHTCSGLDNSLLFVFATTGVIGLLVFGQDICRIIKNTDINPYGLGLLAAFIAIFIHGMFTETFFYNFVLGWVAILVGITRKNNFEKIS